jgi:hypothetical protein
MRRRFFSDRGGAQVGRRRRRNVVQFTTHVSQSQDIPRFMQYWPREFPKFFPDGAYPSNIVDGLVQEQFLFKVQTGAAV